MRAIPHEATGTPWGGGPFDRQHVAKGVVESRAGGRNVILFTLAALVLMRLFTEVLPVLPRAANFADVPLALVLFALTLAQPRLKAKAGGIFATGILLLTMCVVGVVANPTRVAPGPVALFLIGIFEPLIFYYAALRLWPAGNGLALSRLFVALGSIQLVVAASIDLPRYLHSRSPDEFSGTFGENPYQLVFFLLVVAALIAGIAACEPRRVAARLAPLFFVGAFAVIFMAQYRSLLVTTGMTSVLIAGVLRHARARGLLTGFFVILAIVVSLTYVAQRFPLLRLSPALHALRQEPGALFSEKLQTFRTVLDLYANQPEVMLTGTGPGTYSSRAWETFALLGLESKANVAGPYVSRLTGGIAYHTDVSDRYVLPRYQNGPRVFGSHALSSPLVSYTSLLAEVGLIGFAAAMVLYLSALLTSARAATRAIKRRTPGDPLPALLLATTVAFFVLLQMALFGNWLEVTRVTIPAWVLLAVARKELLVRHDG